jgi:4-amino-4-deoxychorismate lyase
MYLVDGQEHQGVPADDRGLQYGDGLFETVAVVRSGPVLWNAHMDRLATGCRRLGIPRPSDEALAEDARQAIGAAPEGVLKILVSRGSGGRGYAPPESPIPRRIVSFHAYPEYPRERWERGVRVRLCRTRLSDQPALAGLKHLNRLDQVLARSEWNDPAIAEGLMLSQNGGLIEGTMSNLFAIHGERVVTPPLERCGVRGVMRGWVLAKLRDWGIPSEERVLDPSRLCSFDHLFLTNSVFGIWPVRRLDDREWEKGDLITALQRSVLHAGLVPVPGGEYRGNERGSAG